NPPSIDNALAITRRVPVDIRLIGPGLDWASDPDFPLAAELDFAGSQNVSSEAGAFLRDLDGVQFATHSAHGFLRIEQAPYAIIVSSPKIAEPAVERRLTPIIMGFGLLLVALTYLAVRWLFKPIDAIRAGAAEIGRGNFRHRIEAGRADELGDLAGDINTMAGDVEGMLDAKRQLLLGISHELRSPLSRLNLALEMAEQDDDTAGLRADVAEMEKIIATLLEAERLNARHAALRLSSVEAGTLVQAMINDYFSGDSERIELEVPEEVRLTVDEARITLLLKNLVSNALRYTRPVDGAVEISIAAAGDAWQIRVRDHGPGLTADQAAHLGEPFYRGDPSRTRHTGGSGLGLYLAKLVAEAHGGSLQLDSSVTDGACFVVTLPYEPGS
ncbi:MAG: HAMP domain-containing histidine kinase, partial [Gammaproteobacteria bacterium]|nr:HAMP domain-containing histidine kinase [Gammaproteobacteria bacterium]